VFSKNLSGYSMMKILAYTLVVLSGLSSSGTLASDGVQLLFDKALQVRQSRFSQRLHRRHLRDKKPSGRRLQSCTFEELTAFNCTIADFCLYEYGELPGEEVTCGGSLNDTWYARFVYDEWCFADYYDYEGGPYDEATFDPETGYCEEEIAFLNFTNLVLSAEDFNVTITRPVESMGRIEGVYLLTSCADAEEPVYDFNRAYCYVDCPEIHVGGIMCEKECITCPNGDQTLNCSNVDPTLVEQCNADADDDLYEEYVAHFKDIRGSKFPSPAPQTSPTANPTLRPTASSTSTAAMNALRPVFLLVITTAMVTMFF
jgi:hypothetical protein